MTEGEDAMMKSISGGICFELRIERLIGLVGGQGERKHFMNR